MKTNLKLALNRIATMGNGQVRLNRAHGRETVVYMDGAGRIVVERSTSNRRGGWSRRWPLAYVTARLDRGRAADYVEACFSDWAAATDTLRDLERAMKNARADVQRAADDYTAAIRRRARANCPAEHFAE